MNDHFIHVIAQIHLKIERLHSMITQMRQLEAEEMSIGHDSGLAPAVAAVAAEGRPITKPRTSPVAGRRGKRSAPVPGELREPPSIRILEYSVQLYRARFFYLSRVRHPVLRDLREMLEIKLRLGQLRRDCNRLLHA